MDENNGAPVAEVQEEVVAETSQETSAESNEQVEKLNRAFEDQKKRAEIAERELKVLKGKTVPSSSDSKIPSPKELAAIAKVAAEVHEDDFDDVVNYAHKMGVGYLEAKKYLDPVLKVKAEQRKSAEAANVSPARRSTVKVTDDQILERAKSDLPESDDDIQRLVSARLKTRQ